jgi:aspartyl-tRNA synthetase
VAGSGFKVFANVVKKGGIVKALNAKGCIDFTRKEIDDLTDFRGRLPRQGAGLDQGP